MAREHRAALGAIILFALGPSVFPMLRACVAIIFSRPEPRGLLLSFYTGGLLISLTTGFVVLGLFNDNHKALGSTKPAPHPANSIVVGVVALLFAWLMTSTRGNALIDRWRARRARRRDASGRDAGPSWAERRLGGASAKIAFVVGAAINLPDPLYVLALGKISQRNGVLVVRRSHSRRWAAGMWIGRTFQPSPWGSKSTIGLPALIDRLGL